jgi:hypothetical protein
MLPSVNARAPFDPSKSPLPPRFFKEGVKLWEDVELRTVFKTGISTAIARRAF